MSRRSGAGPTVAEVAVGPLTAAMKEPFEIATGKTTEVRNVLARVTLSDGTRGYGEGAPMTRVKGETQDSTLAAARRGARALLGRPIAGYAALLAKADAVIGRREGAARAALSTAALDAYCRGRGLPLRRLFGGAESRVFTDVTVTIGSVAEAVSSARRILGRGITTLKIKIGKDIAEDAERVSAVWGLRRGLRLILDANCGYGPGESIELLARLRPMGVRVALFEQPALGGDWKGLARVHEEGRVAVAADESVLSAADARRMARVRAAQVINIKIMKYGLLEAWEIARIARASGLGLMIGGQVESSLAMTASAHLAAGFGGFDFVDLDTPLWFAREPVRGMRIGPRGAYDLRPVKAGIGVTPARELERSLEPV